MESIFCNCEDVVNFLLQRDDINVNLQNGIGYTALMYASHRKYYKIVKMLLNRKDIDVNIRDRDKNTALYIASKHNLVNIVELLLKNENIDINLNNRYGYTPLSTVTEFGNRYCKIIIK